MPIALMLAAVGRTELAEWAPASAVDTCRNATMLQFVQWDDCSASRCTAWRRVFPRQEDMIIGTPAAVWHVLSNTISAWREAGEVGDLIRHLAGAQRIRPTNGTGTLMPRAFTGGDTIDTTSVAPTYDLASTTVRISQRVGLQLALGSCTLHMPNKSQIGNGHIPLLEACRRKCDRSCVWWAAVARPRVAGHARLLKLL